MRLKLYINYLIIYSMILYSIDYVMLQSNYPHHYTYPLGKLLGNCVVPQINEVTYIIIKCRHYILY